jgi:hypothetical protein
LGWPGELTLPGRDRFTLNEPMQEVWRPVVGWEGVYEVSDLGRVKSLARVVMRSNGRPQRCKERILKASRNHDGYYKVRLICAPRDKTCKVATLVALAFIGPRPEKQVVRHGPGGQLDDSLANLCWGTEKENAADKLRDGTHNRGEQNSGAKLTQEQVLLARKEAASKPRGAIARLAKEWGVHHETLRQAVIGKNWGHLNT